MHTSVIDCFLSVVFVIVIHPILLYLNEYAVHIYTISCIFYVVNINIEYF